MNATEKLKEEAAALKERIDNYNPNHKEGPVASAIEDYTSRIPSDTFLWAAFGSIAISAALKFTGRDRDAQFVGQWAPSFMLLGIYNKIVKVNGYQRDKK